MAFVFSSTELWADALLSLSTEVEGSLTRLVPARMLRRIHAASMSSGVIFDGIEKSELAAIVVMIGGLGNWEGCGWVGSEDLEETKSGGSS